MMQKFAGKAVVLTHQTGSLPVLRKYHLDIAGERRASIRAVVKRFKTNAELGAFIGGEAYNAAKTLEETGALKQARKTTAVGMAIAAAVGVIGVWWGVISYDAANYLSSGISFALGAAGTVVALAKSAARKGIDFVRENMADIERSMKNKL